jgi:prepilin-type N-terminal cleavage/methylation domain-containing protein
LVRSRRSGYTLLEMVIAMAIFGVVTFILLSLTRELAFWERRLKLDFLRHPQIIAVISRMRRDVADGYGPNPYDVPGFENTDKTLVLTMLHESGGTQVVEWDFSTPGVVERRAHNVGTVTKWRARGVPPDFTADITSATNPNPYGIVGVRIKAVDSRGRVAIDQTFFPRTTMEFPVAKIPKK